MKIFIFVILVHATESTWEDIPTPDGYESVFIPSTVHRQLSTCLNDLEELKQENQMLWHRVSKLSEQLKLASAQQTRLEKETQTIPCHLEHNSIPVVSLPPLIPIMEIPSPTEPVTPLTHCPTAHAHFPFESFPDSSGRSRSAPPTVRTVQHSTTNSTEILMDNIPMRRNSNESVSQNYVDSESLEFGICNELQSGVMTPTEPSAPTLITSPISDPTTQLVPEPNKDQQSTGIEKKCVSHQKRRKKKKKSKTDTQTLVEASDHEDDDNDDQLLEEYKAKAPPPQRTLTIYETDVIGTKDNVIPKLERDLIAQHPTALIVVQSFDAEPEMPPIPKSAYKHPDFPQHNRLAARFGALSRLTPAVMGFTECFQLRNDGNRFDFSPSDLFSWLKLTVFLLSDHNQTTHYFQSFKDDYFTLHNGSLGRIEKQTLRMMDLIDSTARQNNEPCNLAMPSNFFSIPLVIDICSQFFRNTIHRLLTDQRMEILNKHPDLSASTFKFLGTNAECYVGEVLERQIREFTQHITATTRSLWKFVDNEGNVTEDDVKEALHLVNKVQPLIRHLELTKRMMDLSMILADWLRIPELGRYNIYITNVGNCVSQKWKFLRKLTAQYNIKLVRYGIRKLDSKSTRSNAKQRKSRRAGTSTVLFDKFEADLLPE